MFRNIPIVTKNLLIINVLVFLVALSLGQDGIAMKYYGGLHYFQDSDFHLYQFVTYMFLHANFTHLFFNMFALWMFGCVIERVWGPQKFLLYYLVCGLGAGLSQELVQMCYGAGGLTIGASGAVYGILLAFGMTFPNERIFIFPIPVPIKAKYFICIYAAIELFSAYSSSMDGVAHVAHLGGMLFGLLLILYWRRRPGKSFNMGSGRQFFENMKRNFDAHKGSSQQQNLHATKGGATRGQTGYGPTREDDQAYNAMKKQRQDEVDKILDKIRKSGYDSLSKEEKQRLFEASRER